MSLFKCGSDNLNSARADLITKLLDQLDRHDPAKIPNILHRRAKRPGTRANINQQLTPDPVTLEDLYDCGGARPVDVFHPRLLRRRQDAIDSAAQIFRLTVVPSNNFSGGPKRNEDGTTDRALPKCLPLLSEQFCALILAACRASHFDKLGSPLIKAATVVFQTSHFLPDRFGRANIGFPHQ
jgi:hypothetical protein